MPRETSDPRAGRGRRATSASKPPAAADDARILLDLVAQAEVKGHPVRYDVTFGFGRYDPPGRAKPITRMTLDELDAFQTELLARAGSSAVGKYQINRATLRELRKQLGLEGGELFGPELQERLARRRLAWTGFDGYLAGRVSEAKFRDRLSGAWASVPLPGDRARQNQPLGATDAEVRAALERIRAGRVTRAATAATLRGAGSAVG